MLTESRANNISFLCKWINFTFKYKKTFQVQLQEHIDKIVDKVIQFAPDVVSALLVLIIGLWVITRIAALANKAFERRDLDVSLRTFLKSLISIGLKII